MIALRRFPVPLPLVLIAVMALGLAAMLRAQIEGGERGVPPIDSSSSFEVSGIDVDTFAGNSDAARLAGWREAQRKGWDALWGRTHGGEKGPALSDSALDGIVAGIVVENEQIGPRRYIARLGVLFDRARAGAILGSSGGLMRSAPMLLIPVQWSGGVPQAFETRTEWQQAWARFRTGNSPVDYVRPTGSGGESLLLTYGQTTRRSRVWWNNILDSYGASDIIVPIARLERQWPGGPVKGTFTARYGPDNTYLGEFAMTAPNEAALPQMLAQAVQRFDQMFTQALDAGKLRPDPTLGRQNVQINPAVQALLDTARQQEAAAAAAQEGKTVIVAPGAAPAAPALEAQTVNGFTVQFVTPNAASVDASVAAVRAVPGVRSAATSSIAIGGTSVMRISFAGDVNALAEALKARGFQVNNVAGVLVIRR